MEQAPANSEGFEEQQTREASQEDTGPVMGSTPGQQTVTAAKTSRMSGTKSYLDLNIASSTDEDQALFEELAKLDKDGNRKLSLSELTAYLREESIQKKSANKTKIFQRKVIIGLVLSLLFLLLGMMAVSFVAATLAQPLAVQDGSLEDKGNGKVVKVGSVDMEVNPEGRLVARAGVSKPSSCHQTSCRRLEADPDKPTLVTQAAPKSLRQLTSVVPDQFLSELAKMKLTVEKDDADVDVTIDVHGFTRNLKPGSKCGSIVELKTAWGALTIDDADIYMSPTFHMQLRQEGYHAKQDSKAHGHTRRLSAAAAAVGLFNFIMQYDWRCESSSRPLETLKPPYTFTMETLVYCPGDCLSQHVRKQSVASNSSEVEGQYMKLPGLAHDHETSVYNYISVTETVWATDVEMIRKSKWPNLPNVEIISRTNLTTGDRTTMRKLLLPSSHKVVQCASSNNPMTFRDADNWEIADMGATESVDRTGKNKWYRRLQFFLKQTKTGTNLSVTPDQLRRSTVELWEDMDTAKPFKYFLPHQLEGTSISIFKSFTKDVNTNTMEDMKQDLNDDCNEWHVDPELQNESDVLSEVSVFEERKSVLLFYQDMHRLQEFRPKNDYWKAAVKLQWPEQANLSMEENTTNLTEGNNSGNDGVGRRLDEEDLESQRESVSRQLAKKKWKLNELQEAGVDVKCLIQWPAAGTDLGKGNLQLKFCEREYLDTGALYKEMIGHASGSGNYGPIIFGAEGDLRLRCPKNEKARQNQPTGCVGIGGFKLQGGLGGAFMKGFLELSLTLEGRVEVEVRGDGTFKFLGQLFVRGSIVILGMGPQIYGGLEATFDNLGPMPDPFTKKKKKDDWIKIMGKIGFEISFFFFTIEWSLPITFIDTHLWGANPDDFGKSNDLSEDCQYSSRSHDDCSRDCIQVVGAYQKLDHGGEQRDPWLCRSDSDGVHAVLHYYSLQTNVHWNCVAGQHGTHVSTNFPPFNKLIVTREKGRSTRRIGWVTAQCDEYLTPANKYGPVFGNTWNGCYYGVGVKTKFGRVEVWKPQNPDYHGYHWENNWIEMGQVHRDSGTFEFDCLASRWDHRRRDGYSWRGESHHSNYCGGEMNRLQVGWARRRGGAVRWRCQLRYGSERDLDPHCKATHGLYYAGRELKRLGQVETWFHCSNYCGENSECYYWTYDSAWKSCRLHSTPKRHLTFYWSDVHLSMGRPSLWCPKTCARPQGWCHIGYEYKDCDGDGIADHYCKQGSATGFLSSAASCQDTWPRGSCGKSKCPRPQGWCINDIGYAAKDCDGDGFADHYCGVGSSTGYISTASSCIDTWPHGRCLK